MRAVYQVGTNVPATINKSTEQAWMGEGIDLNTSSWYIMMTFDLTCMCSRVAIGTSEPGAMHSMFELWEVSDEYKVL